MPAIKGVLETSLYVDDLARSVAFYKRVLGFELLQTYEPRLAVMNVVGRQVLLLFKKGASVKPSPTPGGTVPPTDGSGNLHLTFSIPASDFELWRESLTKNNIAIESEVRWETGSQSLYFRDPDGHVLELMTVPGAWGIF